MSVQVGPLEFHNFCVYCSCTVYYLFQNPLQATSYYTLCTVVHLIVLLTLCMCYACMYTGLDQGARLDSKW